MVECEGRRYQGCKAKVQVLGEEIVKEHNRAADVALKEVIKIRSTTKRRAERTEEIPQANITQACRCLGR